jgi:hypothetical protein
MLLDLITAPHHEQMTSKAGFVFRRLFRSEFMFWLTVQFLNKSRSSFPCASRQQ